MSADPASYCICIEHLHRTLRPQTVRGSVPQRGFCGTSQHHRESQLKPCVRPGPLAARRSPRAAARRRRRDAKRRRTRRAGVLAGCALGAAAAGEGPRGAAVAAGRRSSRGGLLGMVRAWGAGSAERAAAPLPCVSFSLHWHRRRRNAASFRWDLRASWRRGGQQGNSWARRGSMRTRPPRAGAPPYARRVAGDASRRRRPAPPSAASTAATTGRPRPARARASARRRAPRGILGSGALSKRERPATPTLCSAQARPAGPQGPGCCPVPFERALDARRPAGPAAARAGRRPTRCRRFKRTPAAAPAPPTPTPAPPRLPPSARPARRAAPPPRASSAAARARPRG
jgi:hypothetical protein